MSVESATPSGAGAAVPGGEGGAPGHTGITAWVVRHAAALRLFFLAFLTLYLELALIRFTSAEVLYLGYFSNLILVAVFLGIGLGFLLAPRRLRLAPALPVALLFMVAFVLVAKIDVTVLRERAGQIFFGLGTAGSKLSPWAALPLLFATTVLVFAAIAQETGRAFGRFPPLRAYSLDIAGSLAGIALFSLHAWLEGSPLLWFVVAFVLVLGLAARGERLPAVLAGAGVVLLLVASGPAHYVAWSPYQRIDVLPVRRGGVVAGYSLTANGIGHQTMAPLDAKEPIYDFPYVEVDRLHGGRSYRSMLVIGSGGGTDVSFALARGVERIDAVEIDPEILRAGRTFHPLRPYADPRVTAHVDDGRSFMERARGPYDLVVYALPDSLAAYSSLANIRLESFLFTVESFRQARRLLAPDGVLVLYNYYRQPWLVAKLAGMLEEAFGRAPVIRSYSDRPGTVLAALAVGPQVRGDAAGGPRPRPATDNWPFLYMQAPRVPPMYLIAMGLFVLCGLLAVLLTGNLRAAGIGRYGPFALMGAAFFLLETKSVIQFALLFGATWLVNALVFFAILASVLAANVLAARLELRRPLVPFLLLGAVLALQLAIPFESLLGVRSLALRYVAASTLVFAPVVLANVAFACIFRTSEDSARAFGLNIVGSMVGAALEYSSLALGYRALGWVVVGLYVVAAAWAVTVTRRAGAATSSAPCLTSFSFFFCFFSFIESFGLLVFP